MGGRVKRTTAFRQSHYLVHGRFLLILVAVLAVGVLLLWHCLLPDNPTPIPGSLTERDKQRIGALCRRYTLRYSLDKLRSGEFGWFFRSVQVLFKQKIDRFIDDEDGTYRIYVIVYDKQASDGFNPWARHQVAMTNGHWKILRSY